MDLSSITTSSKSEWLATAKKSAGQVQSSIVAIIPDATGGAIGSSLLANIYDNKVISPKLLNAYWERTGTGPNASSTTDSSTAASSTTSDSAAATTAAEAGLGSLLDVTA